MYLCGDYVAADTMETVRRVLGSQKWSDPLTPPLRSFIAPSPPGAAGGYGEDSAADSGEHPHPTQIVGPTDPYMHRLV